MLTQDELAALLSHDLKNPLGVISTYVELLARQELTPTGQRQLSNIRRAAERMSRMLENIATATRIEAGRLELNRQRIEAVLSLNDAIDAVHELAAERELKLDVKLAPRLGALEGDRAALKNVFFALLHNAVRLSPPGSSVKVSARRAPGARALFEFQDQGPGFDLARVEKLFECNLRDSSPSREKGLSLFIARAIVEAHGGKLEARPAAPRPGALFRITLPCCPVRTKSATTATTAALALDSLLQAGQVSRDSQNLG